MRCAIYARVASAKQEQEGNLLRQVERLQHVAKERGYLVVSLIQEQASGLNEKRKGLKRLLHLIEQQEIDLVLIEYPDRLVRFGSGSLEETFRWKLVSIEVGEPPKLQTPTEELVQDLPSIVTVFSGRLYGSRAKKVRSCVSHALKECLKAEETDGTSRENNQTPDKLTERVAIISKKTGEVRDGVISAETLLTWAEFQTGATRDHPDPLPEWNFSTTFPDFRTAIAAPSLKMS